MEQIRRRAGIRAPRPAVLAKLTTPDDLASWWTGDVAGEPTPYPGEMQISSWG
jgi:hypothetical protein